MTETAHLATRRTKLLFLLALTTVSAFWFQLFSPIARQLDAVPSFDAVFFIKMAENILTYKEFGWIGYHEPPLYSLATAALTLVTGDLAVAAVFISRLSITLLPGVVFLLGCDLFSARIGAVAAVVTLFFPHLTVIAGGSQSEGLYMLLMTCSVWLLWRAWRAESLLLGCCAGLFFAAAYLTRSEGIFIFMFLLLFLLAVSRWQGRTVRFVIATLVAFGLICGPYIGYLSSHYGAMTVGTKTSGIYFWVRDKCFNDPDPERAEWGLSPQGELNVISMRSKDLMGYWGRDLPRSLRVYLKNFSEQLPGRIPNDGGIKQYPQVFPLYLAIPLVLGLAVCRRRREYSPASGYLLPVFLLLLVYPFLTGGWWRYLVTLLPFFLILSALALEQLASLFGRRCSPLSPRVPMQLLWGVVALISLYHVWTVRWQAAPDAVVTYQKDKATVSDETRQAAAWARKIIPAAATYMAQWTRLPYYIPGRWIALPEADLSSLLGYARKNGVSYLLIESHDPQTAVRLSTALIPGIAYVGSYISPVIDYSCTIVRLL